MIGPKNLDRSTLRNVIALVWTKVILVLLGNPSLLSASVGPLLLGLPVDAAVAAMCSN